MEYILVTGTSSGIGRELVIELCKREYFVFAGLRNLNDVDNTFKNAANIIPIQLDVTDDKSIVNAVDYVEKSTKEKGIQAIINNAAVAIGGPIEFSNSEIIRQHFEVGFFGAIRIVQNFLPLIRKGSGKIINVSSTNGFVSFPYMAAYSASKFALEAFNNALRIELKEWKIPVILINPDKINTPMWEKSIKKTELEFYRLKEEEKKLYINNFKNFIKTIKNSQKSSSPASIVINDILKALNSNGKKNRYLTGFSTKVLFLFSRILPSRILDRMIEKELKI